MRFLLVFYFEFDSTIIHDHLGFRYRYSRAIPCGIGVLHQVSNVYYRMYFERCRKLKFVSMRAYPFQNPERSQKSGFQHVGWTMCDK